MGGRGAGAGAASREDRARQLFEQEYPVVQADRAGAGERRRLTERVADQAYGGVTAFRPEGVQAFDPTQFGVSDSVGTLEAFDPTEYGTTFARGAYGDFQAQLGDELTNLTNRSVGAGRLRTGFFDQDQGGVVMRLGSDFNNRIAQASTVFSGQRLDALRSGAQLREGAVSRIADLSYNRARDLDESNFRTRNTALGASMDRERLASDEYQRNADRIAEYVSANREWAAMDREREERGGGDDTRVASPRRRDPYAAARAALGLGVM